VKPIPVQFHIGPLDIHTYGIGLALTFWFALWYFERRLRTNGYPTQWLTQSFLWIVAAALVGARAVHVVANLSYYTHNPGDVVAVWHGGLSSFGGLLLGVPTGLWLVHRRCPELGLWEGLNLVAPVLVAAWALGRLLGPQLMIAGGGHPTTSWIGLEYAGQVGKRLPVPLFQAAECFAIYCFLLWVERRVKATGGPTGLVLASACAIWGLSRFADEWFWLRYPGQPGDVAVEVAGLALAASGLGAAAVLVRRHRRETRASLGGEGSAAVPPVPSPEVPTPTSA
jgi:phosphatidylglycerol:prolipoprotein diacylglycerol transferase